MRPGGRTTLLSCVIAVVCSCLMATTASGEAGNSCAPVLVPVLLVSNPATVPVGCADQSAPNPTSFELKAVASDRGAYWFEADDPRILTRIALTTDEELNRSITFRANNLATTYGAIDVRGGVGRIETSDALTFERLQYADGYRQDNSAIGVGVTQHLLDDRLMLSTDLAWSTSTSLWNGVSETGSMEVLSRQGSAHWHRLEAKIVDDPDFKWSVTGQVSSVDKGFLGNSAARPLGLMVQAGDASRWATKIVALGVTAQASIEQSANLTFVREANRLELEVDGISAALYAKTMQQQLLLETKPWTRRKVIEGATVEIMPELLAPAIAGESTLVPKIVSVTYEQGLVAFADDARASDAVTLLDALVMWKSSLGETTAVYSAERTGHDGASQAFEGDDYHLIDVSHRIKLGNWRASAGVSHFAYQTTLPDEVSADASISGHFSLRYAPASGPQFEARLGRREGEFAAETEDLISRSLGTTLSVTLDLTDVVQRALDRRDTFLKIQYRHELKESELVLEDTIEEATRNKDALLLSFGTPLN
jgi:hypothetical protein